jgi:hypothetical protein
MNFTPGKAPSPTPPYKRVRLKPPHPRRRGTTAWPLGLSPFVGEMGSSPEGVFSHHARNVSP